MFHQAPLPSSLQFNLKELEYIVGSLEDTPEDGLIMSRKYIQVPLTLSFDKSIPCVPIFLSHITLRICRG
jgi:hypothetical protein